MKQKQWWKIAALTVCALGLSGCDGDFFVVGNMATMGITCAMLWSTVHLKKEQ